MARVTVEDCIDKVKSRFELVMVASQRARKISSGASLLVDRDNDKNPVIALREIAEEKLEVDDLKEELVRNYQRIIESDDTEEVIDSMEGEEEWSKIAASQNEPLYEDEMDVSDEADVDASAEEGEMPSLEDMAGGA